MSDMNEPEHNAVLLTGGALGEGSRKVMPGSLSDVAQLIGCATSDLTYLPYGNAGQMWMSRIEQLDRGVALNRDAIFIAVKLHQKRVVIRGSVVCFPAGPRFVERTTESQPAEPRKRSRRRRGVGVV